MTLLIIYVALAIAVSFVCSILEAVLLSVTPTFIGTVERDRPALARRLKMLKDDIDRPLAAILSLNTIAHTVGAAGAGAQAAIVFGDTSVAIFSAVLTFLILVLSEIIPKTLGAMYWQAFAPAASRILPALIWTMWPLVRMSQGITRLLSRGRAGHAVTREEIMAMADIGHREGIIDEADSRIVTNLLRFNRLKVEDIMTPRTVVLALPEDRAIADVARTEDLPFSRLPIFRETIDTITGFVLKTDILIAALEPGNGRTLRDLRRDLVTVSSDTLLQDLFDLLLERGHHIALVADPFGGTAGIVTLEDLVETLLGLEIVDETDRTEDLQLLARRNWEKRKQRKAAERTGTPPPPPAGAHDPRPEP